MSQGTRRLYVDSRFKLSGTNSDFTYDLGDQLDLGERPIAWITEVTIPSSWHTIQAGRNDRLYVREKPAGELSDGTLRVATITPGAYDAETLRVAIEAALNGAGSPPGSYVVARSNSLGTTAAASLGAAYRFYTVTAPAGYVCIFPSDDWLAANHSAPGFESLNPQSTNEIVSFPNQVFSASQVSSFLDLRGVHTAYIHMPGFTSYSTLAPGGRRTVVAKVPIDSAFGSIVSWQHAGAGHDFIDVGVQSLRQFSVELRDARGNYIDLQGAHWSFTIVFSQR